MKAHLSLKDYENLSAYLDGQLPPAENRRLEEQLKNDPDRQAALQEIAATRTLLRSAPRYRAPRNFTLTPEMARQNTRRSFFPALPAFRFSAAMAALSLLAVFMLELSGLLTANQSSIVAQAPQAAPAMAPLPTQAPAAAEKSAPAQSDQAQPQPTLAIQWQPLTAYGLGGSGGGSSPDQPQANAKPQFGMGGGGPSENTSPLTGPLTLPPSAVESLPGNAVQATSPETSRTMTANSQAGNPILGLPSQEDAGKMIEPNGQLQEIPEVPAPQPQERITARVSSPASSSWLSPRRSIEVGLVILGLITGLGAIYFRRKAS